jgi:hypothetical protein
MIRKKAALGGPYESANRNYHRQLRNSIKFSRPARRVGSRPSNRINPKGIISVSNEGMQTARIHGRAPR